MEFMRMAPADGTGVGQHRAKFQTEPCKDIAIGQVHHIVSVLQRCLVQVKRIGIFHQKLAGAHDSEARTDFVAEFGLNLVIINRQLLVAFDLGPCQIGDDFLMGRA